MAFLGGSVSVFALRWAVGFLGNISRPRDMGFNARVTATVMLTGIGSWHLAPVTWPGPARPAYLCGGIWWKACCLIRPSWSIYRVCGKYAGAQVYYIHPRSSSVDGTYCSFWQPCSPPIPVWPESVTPTGRFADQVLAGVEPPGISTAARGLDLVCSVAPSHTITNYDSCLRQTVTGVRK